MPAISAGAADVNVTVYHHYDDIATPVQENIQLATGDYPLGGFALTQDTAAQKRYELVDSGGAVVSFEPGNSYVVRIYYERVFDPAGNDPTPPGGPTTNPPSTNPPGTNTPGTNTPGTNPPQSGGSGTGTTGTPGAGLPQTGDAGPLGLCLIALLGASLTGLGVASRRLKRT